MLTKNFWDEDHRCPWASLCCPSIHTADSRPRLSATMTERNTAVKSMGVGSRGPGFESQLPHLLEMTLDK